jgi:Trk K+ transport system NAD-binding subunit
MHRSTRRLIVLAAGLVAFIIVIALIYELGMLKLEGKPRNFWRSLEWAVETISTTGFGSDNQWSHPAMVLFVIVIEIAGILLVPVIVSLVLVPFMEEQFERLLPRTAPEMAEQVVVFRYGPAVETLLQRLRSANVPSLVVELDEAAARAVLERELPVVFSRNEEDALDVCRLPTARALVANGTDEQNASIILRARQMGFRREVFAFVEEPSHRKPMELAGATAVYTPRHIVAAALAAHGSDRISPRLPGAESIPSIHRREMRVPLTSPVAGMTLGEARLGEESGAIVVGQWLRSRLHARCNASMRIEPGALLEMVGTDEALDRAAILIGGVYLRQSGPFIVGGFGEVGRKVHELLRDAGEEVRVVERQAAPGVDVAGNVLDTSVLEQAGLATARTVILALNSDDATLFATVIVRDAAPNVTVIARVNHSRNLENMYRAGADYALSISDISGEMLSARLLGRVARTREEHRQVVRVPVRAAAGQRVGELGIRAHGCSLIGLERGGAFVDVTAGTALAAGDQGYLCGNAESLKAAAAAL